MKPLKIFIDTEFTNFIDTGLISMGLVAESGKEAYWEVPYKSSECSDFVHAVVLPLLGREALTEIDKAHLRAALLTWLTIVRPSKRDIVLCFDYQTDWDLFIDALDYRVPEWISGRNVNHEIDELLYQEFFKQTGLSEHHALYDARANAYAFREQFLPL